MIDWDDITDDEFVLVLNVIFDPTWGIWETAKLSRDEMLEIIKSIGWLPENVRKLANNFGPVPIVYYV